jgi:predicted RNA-binding Zn-ribbon protein involved in translation (DUF1610 family)
MRRHKPATSIVMRRRREEVSDPGKESAIITGLGTGIDRLTAGASPGTGTFFCASCGSQLSLRESDQLPECPRCGATEYQRDSIFEARQDHGQTAEMALPAAVSKPGWLEAARAKLAGPGRYIALRDDEGEVRVFPIAQGWTRIGRSATADIRLDDPSVSRRHALIVSERPDSLRVLDDRSLNGVFLNGEIVEWGRFADGDELAIGRFRLFVLEA